MRLSVPFLPLVLILERRPMSPPRWRLRDAMIAVAVVAVVIALATHLAGLSRRSAEFANLARQHATQASHDRYLAGQALRSIVAVDQESLRAAESARRLQQGGDLAGAEASRRLAIDHSAAADRLRESSALWGRRIAYYERLVKKYQFAEKHPLLPTWPDPEAP